MDIKRWSMMKKNPCKWNLQLFTEDGGADGNDGGGEGKEGNGEGVSFDDFLKDSKNQAEFDRRVTKAMNTQKAKLEEEFKKKISDAKTEAQKLAEMSDKEKNDKQIATLNEEIEKLKAIQTHSELSKTASGLLKEKKVDPTQDILEFAVGADAEATQANIDRLVSIKEAWRKEWELERAKGTTPKTYGKDKEDNITAMQSRIAKYKKE